MTPEIRPGIHEMEYREFPTTLAMELVARTGLLHNYFDARIGQPLRYPMVGRVATCCWTWGRSTLRARGRGRARRSGLERDGVVFSANSAALVARDGGQLLDHRVGNNWGARKRNSV